ncbi:MAG: NADP-dependent phosphogluconate dehydrogenase, partial [Candidatus Hydrogenedentales bacterium]
YADMQLIAEAYWLLRSIGGMEPAAQAEVFRDWNAGELQSYLIEITVNIFDYTDAETGAPMVDVILDAAGQKGTGSWTSQNALELGAPTPTIAEAVFARCISAIKGARVDAAHVLEGPTQADGDIDVEQLVADVEQALYASKIAVYAQGFQLLRYASAQYQWDLDFGAIAGTWRAGCIIRARFLEAIRAAFAEDPTLANLMTAEPFRGKLHAAQRSWRRVVSLAAEHGVPAPAIMSALAYYDGYRSATLPANLIQAQRDYFGAHTYERADRPRGEFFHTDWTTS